MPLVVSSARHLTRREPTSRDRLLLLNWLGSVLKKSPAKGARTEGRSQISQQRLQAEMAMARPYKRLTSPACADHRPFRHRRRAKKRQVNLDLHTEVPTRISPWPWVPRRPSPQHGPVRLIPFPNTCNLHTKRNTSHGRLRPLST